MHPHVPLRMSVAVMVAFIACFLLSGCGKQEKPAPAKMPQVSKEPSAATADTGDIFKEFYSEDSTKKKAGGKSKKVAKQETFSPSASSSSFQPEFSAKGRYTVQITCVRSKSFADGVVGKMKDKGYPAYVAEVQNPTPNLSGTYYRVRIGGFAGLSAAKSFGENVLVPGGNQYWVDKKSNDNVGMEGYGLGSGTAGSNAASSYDNATTTPASSYQPAPAATPAAPSSSYESSTSPYSSPSSSSSSTSGASSPASSGSASSTTQQPATTTGTSGAASAPSPSGSAASAGTTSSASSSSPAPSSAASATPSSSSSSTPSSAASTAPSSTPSGATSGKAGAGSSTESGWGTDSSSKSGW